MSDKTTQTLLFAVLLCVGALMYLDWKRQGELDLLHERLDNLNLSLRGTVAEPVQAPPPPAAAAPVSAAPAAPAPPSPAPERAYAVDVIDDPVPGDGFMPSEAPSATEVHPLLRSVLQAHNGGNNQ